MKLCINCKHYNRLEVDGQVKHHCHRLVKYSISLVTGERIQSGRVTSCAAERFPYGPCKEEGIYYEAVR